MVVDEVAVKEHEEDLERLELGPELGPAVGVLGQEGRVDVGRREGVALDRGEVQQEVIVGANRTGGVSACSCRRLVNWLALHARGTHNAHWSSLRIAADCASRLCRHPVHTISIRS